MNRQLTTNDIFSMYNRLMSTDVEIENVYQERRKFWLELTRPLNEREVERFDELQAETTVELRVVVEHRVRGEEMAELETQVAQTEFQADGVLSFTVPPGKAGAHASERIREAERLLDILNAEKGRKTQAEVRAEERRAREEADEREFARTVTDWRSRRRASRSQ